MNDAVFLAGLDLGQVNDPSALAILERRRCGAGGGPKPIYSVRFLHRFQLGTSYPDIVASVRGILGRPPLDKCQVYLAVDQTGCGRAVADLFRAIWPGVAAISITGGEQASASPTGLNVPKRELSGIVQLLLQTRRLLIASGLPEAAQLKHELGSFKVKINAATGNESFEAWREKDHDDLVLAVAMAAWLGEQLAIGEREAAAEAAEEHLMQLAQSRPGVFGMQDPRL